jgi:hypothetical protein
MAVSDKTEAAAWAKDMVEKLVTARYHSGDVRMDRWYVKCTPEQFWACKAYIRNDPRTVDAHGLDRQQWSFVFEFTEFYVPREYQPVSAPRAQRPIGV